MRAASQSERAIEVHSRQAPRFEKGYEQLARDPYGSCFAYSRMRLDALLSRYIPEESGGKRLLDVGVGTGHHLAALQRRGYQGAGVDGSVDMLRHAQALNPSADLRQADVSKLPFPDRTFDIAICIEVLRYLDDPELSIAEMARVLKPGGTCLATATPLFNTNGYAMVNRLAPLVPFVPLTKLQQFFTTSWTLRSRFREADFEDVQVQGVYFGPINWVERLLPKALPAFLRRWEHVDRRVADLRGVREFANMFLVIATRGR